MDVNSFLIFYKSNESNHISHKSFFSPLRIHFMHFIARVHKIFEVKIRILIHNNNNNNDDDNDDDDDDDDDDNNNNNNGIIQGDFFVTIVIVHLLNPPHRAGEHVNTGYEEHTIRTRVSHFFTWTM